MHRSKSIVVIVVLFASLAGTVPAFAQADTSQIPGITTIGYGEASAPAESARLQFLIIDQDSFYGGPPQAPAVEATPGAEARATVAPIAAAIEANETVESVAVVIPLVTSAFGGPVPVARIEVAVTSPDQDSLTALVSDATQAAAAERLMIGYVGARFEVADCQGLEQEARQAAVDDARSRAEIQAAVLGVEAGEVVASSDLDLSSGLVPGYYGAPVGSGGGCDPDVAAERSGDSYPGITMPAFDPTSDSGVVEVYRQVRVTFAIIGGDGTPVV